MKSEARHSPKFKIGDRVTMINDYGVRFEDVGIVAIDYWEGYPEPRYFYYPSGNPEHYSTKESNFEMYVPPPETPAMRLAGSW